MNCPPFLSHASPPLVMSLLAAKSAASAAPPTAAAKVQAFARREGVTSRLLQRHSCGLRACSSGNPALPDGLLLCPTMHHPVIVVGRPLRTLLWRERRTL